jgi:hypothetical protein
MDRKRLIGEVAARHGVRLEEDDPAFLLVTIAEIAITDAQNQFLEAVAQAVADQEAAAERIQIRLGETLAESIRSALRDVRLPRADAPAGFVTAIVVGLLAGLALLTAGFLLGGIYL